MLPIICPKELDEEYWEVSKRPLYTRFIIFKKATTPPGFWSQLLSRIMHSVQKVALHKTGSNTQTSSFEAVSDFPSLQSLRLNSELDPPPLYSPMLDTETPELVLPSNSEVRNSSDGVQTTSGPKPVGNKLTQTPQLQCLTAWKALNYITGVKVSSTEILR